MERLNALQIQLDTLQGHLQARNISPDNPVYGRVRQLTADVARALTGLVPIDVAQIEAEVGGAAERVAELLAPQSPRSGDRKGGGDAADDESAAASPRSAGSLSPQTADGPGLVGPVEPDDPNLISVSIPGTPVLLPNRGHERSLSELFTNLPGGGGGGGGTPRVGRLERVDSPPSSGIASLNSSAPGSVPASPRGHAAVPSSRSVSPVRAGDPEVEGFKLINALSNDLKEDRDSQEKLRQIRNIFVAAFSQLRDNAGRDNAARRPQSAPVSHRPSVSSSSSSSSSESSSSSSASGSSQSRDRSPRMP
jgi:hypothetical protein